MGSWRIFRKERKGGNDYFNLVFTYVIFNMRDVAISPKYNFKKLLRTLPISDFYWLKTYKVWCIVLLMANSLKMPWRTVKKQKEEVEEFQKREKKGAMITLILSLLTLFLICETWQFRQNITLKNYWEHYLFRIFIDWKLIRSDV